jgi:hypothetical protein
MILLLLQVARIRLRKAGFGRECEHGCNVRVGSPLWAFEWLAFEHNFRLCQEVDIVLKYKQCALCLGNGSYLNGNYGYHQVGILWYQHTVLPKQQRSQHITYSISLARVITSAPNGDGSNSGTVSLIEDGDEIPSHTPHSISEVKLVAPCVPAVSRIIDLMS